MQRGRYRIDLVTLTHESVRNYQTITEIVSKRAGKGLR
jgi:hypothetical protein